MFSLKQPEVSLTNTFQTPASTSFDWLSVEVVRAISKAVPVGAGDTVVL